MSGLLPDLEQDHEESNLLRLLNRAGARGILAEEEVDLGLAERRPYPFLAIVGQLEMRIALMLSVINPAIGGVLLIGPRGTGKTTAVRSLAGNLATGRSQRLRRIGSARRSAGGKRAPALPGLLREISGRPVDFSLRTQSSWWNCR